MSISAPDHSQYSVSDVDQFESHHQFESPNFEPTSPTMWRNASQPSEYAYYSPSPSSNGVLSGNIRESLPDAYTIRELEEQRGLAVSYWTTRVKVVCVLQIVRSSCKFHESI
jgi:hypothetical protein